MTPEKTKEVIEQRLGKPIDAVFAWIDLGAPLGSASIAQVIRKLPIVIQTQDQGCLICSGWYSMHGSMVAFALPPTWDFALEALLSTCSLSVLGVLECKHVLLACKPAVLY